MKIVLFIAACCLLVSCASATHVRVKNCKALGSEMFDCEELSKKDLGYKVK